MSFTSEYLALRKKKQQAQEAAESGKKMSKTTTKKTDIAPVKKSFSDEYLALREGKEEDIAPISDKLTARMTAEDRAINDKKSWHDGWVDRGAFEDGYQFGDIAKTILGTSKDIRESLYEGVLGMAESTIDAGAYIAGTGSGGVGGVGGTVSDPRLIEKLQNGAQKFIAKDIINEEKIAKAVDKLTGGAIPGGGLIAEAIMGGENSDDYSLLGQKADSVLQSGGQLAGQMALQAAGVPWWVTSGVTSFGGEAENAFNQNATYGEAGVSGLISAGAEILTEKISGGIKFGGQTLDDLAKPFLRSISDKALRTAAALGLDIAGEGMEEVLSGLASALGQKLTYASGKDFKELYSSEDAWTNFISGALLSGGTNSAKAVNSAVTGTDYSTGLTANEQKVAEKVYNDRIAEATKGGKKLKAAEKNKIFDEVVKELEKGYISTDTIEEVLGGEEYKTYKETADSEDAVKKEYEDLGKKVNPTLADQNRYAELQKDHTKRDRLERAIERIDKTLELEKADLAEEFNQKKEQLKNKGSYISQKASELYREIRELKKGVRASDQLAQLLDSGYEWSAIRSALVNIKHTPNGIVNVNSAAESIARQMLNEDYENSLYNLDSDYQKKVKELEDAAERDRSEARKAEQRTTRKELHQNILDKVKSVFNTRGFDFDNVLKNAKNLSTFATVDNTPQRVMEKSLGYKEGGVLADITVNMVAQNETRGIKWLNSFTDRKNGLLAQISKQYNIKPGSKQSAAAQMYAEGFYVDEKNNIIQYGDRELAMDFPDAQVQRNIKGLARDPRIRQIYDSTLAAINESRKRNAYPEIPRLENYFLHFRAMDDTFSRLGLPFNPNDIRAKDLPTDLNGVTADLKPGQPYFASAMHRNGKRTSFDLLGGLERYLTSAKNQIYHIDDIQTLRALRNYIADTYGQANGLEGLDNLSEEEAQERIEKVYNSHLSTFAKFLNEEANILAGKTALIDRGLEGIIGRRGISFLNTVNGQVGSNMVGFNISSSLTNFLPVAQTFAKTQKHDFIKAFGQTVANKVGSIFGKSDDFTENSPVIIRRKGSDRFYRTPWQKLGDPGYALMGLVDDISTELIARTKYNEFTRKGMNTQQAHYETDKWVSRLMGDRSLGQQPQLYNSKMLGLITKFQLEVRNQLDSQFYDTIQETKASNEHIQNALKRNAKTAAKVTSTFVQLAVAQHLFGKAFESVAGYNPAFDIIEVIIKACGFDDDEESEDAVLDNIEQGFFALLEDLPYTSTFTGGRIPIESALPVEQFIMGEDEYGNEKSRWETLAEAAPYYLLPGGYGQAKKTIQGLSMFDDDLPIAGSYTDSGNLRFPVDETVGNMVQAGIFGQYASPNARDYFDNERTALNEKQTREFAATGMSIQEYWDYRDGLKGLKTLAEKFDYIDSLDLTTRQKNILVNNLVDREDPVDMTDYGKYSSYEEFDFASKNAKKYAFLEANDISYADYSASEDSKAAYTWAFDNPEKYTVSKAISKDFVEYYRIKGELNDIRADKDGNGNSISGTAKKKKIEYIDNLDLAYGQKIILYKSLYPSDDSYNYDIISYLNSRKDIGYQEMETILTELGFKVDSEGNITW